MNNKYLHNAYFYNKFEIFISLENITIIQLLL